MLYYRKGYNIYIFRIMSGVRSSLTKMEIS